MATNPFAEVNKLRKNNREDFRHEGKETPDGANEQFACFPKQDECELEDEKNDNEFEGFPNQTVQTAVTLCSHT